MAESESPRIALYLSPTNPFCYQVRDFLVRRNVQFVIYDVSEDPLALRIMTHTSYEKWFDRALEFSGPSFVKSLNILGFANLAHTAHRHVADDEIDHDDHRDQDR